MKGELRDFIVDTFWRGVEPRRTSHATSTSSELIGREGAFGRNLWGLLSLELWQQAFHDRQRSGALCAREGGGQAHLVGSQRPKPVTVSAKRYVRGEGSGGSLRYLKSHGRLLLRVTINDLRQRYAGSMLGLGWAFLAPLLVLGVYALIYLEIFRIRVPDLTSAEYVVYVFCGLVPYLAAAEAIAHGDHAVIANKSVLNNTVFPIDLTPVKPVLATQAIMVAGHRSLFLLRRLRPGTRIRRSCCCRSSGC